MQCKNGDVWLEDDGTPLFFWNDKLSLICGNWFWNNQIGATLFCQKLGYTSGTQSGSNLAVVLGEDAITIGECSTGDTLDACTGGCNDYRRGDDACAKCGVDKKAKITIACQGNSTKYSSCNGTLGKGNSIF